MPDIQAFYICPTCFEASETEKMCHGQLMIHCTPDRLSGEKCKPVVGSDGRPLSRAPRWFLEAVGRRAARSFYICPVCFEVAETQRECHGQMMICCDAGALADEQRKPAVTHDGRLTSRAPRWFTEAVGRPSSRR